MIDVENGFYMKDKIFVFKCGCEIRNFVPPSKYKTYRRFCPDHGDFLVEIYRGCADCNVRMILSPKQSETVICRECSKERNRKRARKNYQDKNNANT